MGVWDIPMKRQQTKFSLGTPKQIARREKRYADRRCGCPAKLTCCLSEDNPQGHHVGCDLWGTDQEDLDP